MHTSTDRNEKNRNENSQKEGRRPGFIVQISDLLIRPTITLRACLLLVVLVGAVLSVAVGVSAGVGKVPPGQVWDRLVKTLAIRQSPSQAGQGDKKERPPKSESSGEVRDLPNAPQPTDLTVGVNNGVSRTGAVQGLIAFENTPASTVFLGPSVATRTQCRQLSKQGTTPPYTMTGPDYTYPTFNNYSSSQNLREGREVVPDGGYSTSRSTENVAGRGTMITLTSGGQISANNPNAQGCFGSVFGPQLWTQPFEATAGMALSYDWAAQGGGDDYETYGFLVKLDSPTSYTGTTTIISYGRGTV
ncbi:MAG: hypothetical protein ACK5RS_15380, partial [Acidobacteriota bacterium]